MSFRQIGLRAGSLARPALSAAPRLRVNAASRQLSATTAARRVIYENKIAGVKTTKPGIEFEVGRDTQARRTILPHFWLRDNCRCSQCVNQDTMQRNFDTFAINEDIQPLKIERDNKGLKIKWNQDNHESFYPWDFLNHYLYRNSRPLENTKFKYGIQQNHQDPPTIQYNELFPEKDSGVAKLTNTIRERGFAFVDGVPFDTPSATKEVLERIAFIRETHYGGFYDFIPDMAMADTAYTNIALPAHTDTTYFTDPAGLQAFHMLSHEAPPGSEPSTDGELGGKSLLVDGFHAANVLKQEDKEAFNILTRLRLPWHASGNEGITISPDRMYPVLELHPLSGKVHRVRWNNDDRGVVPFTKDIAPQEWYAAACKWNEILKRPDMEFWTQLTPGRVLIFDNWRVMHGRSAFEGRRRICGGYICRDDFISRWRNTNFPRQQILDRVVG
ncbi:trimethyllysine dioxygenase [Colletotrichum asianum]|uniref:Trimethyllysine dioxygenase n=1 Tax=Colletotrichum asianum TaxID=702518 RepID=A0A8H3WTE5_9PEZI|nr:trimethyllysine dioxygenase [Colletotrichum asianum]